MHQSLSIEESLTLVKNNAPSVLLCWESSFGRGGIVEKEAGESLIVFFSGSG
jgi:hypothetical protein